MNNSVDTQRTWLLAIGAWIVVFLLMVTIYRLAHRSALPMEPEVVQHDRSKPELPASFELALPAPPPPVGKDRETELSPQHEHPQQPERKPEPALKPVAFDPEVMASGEKRLQEGTFPAITLGYHRIGFPRYIRAISSGFGALFIADLGELRLVARVDPLAHTLSALPSEENFEGLNVARPRLISDPAVGDYLSQASAQYGNGRRYGLILLVPTWLDAWLIGEIDAHLAALGKQPAEFLRFVGAYQMKDGSLALEIREGVDQQGRAYPLNLLFDLKQGRS